MRNFSRISVWRGHRLSYIDKQHCYEPNQCQYDDSVCKPHILFAQLSSSNRCQVGFVDSLLLHCGVNLYLQDAPVYIIQDIELTVFYSPHHPTTRRLAYRSLGLDAATSRGRLWRLHRCLRMSEKKTQDPLSHHSPLRREPLWRPCLQLWLPCCVIFSGSFCQGVLEETTAS